MGIVQGLQMVADRTEGSSEKPDDGTVIVNESGGVERVAG